MGEICFPDNLSVSPEALAMWYVSDGYLSHDSREGRRSRVEFSSRNEAERPEAIVGALEAHGFTVGHSGADFRLFTEDTEDFFDLIGHDPIVGFEYKWEYEDYDRYKAMKDLCGRAHTTQTLE